MTNPLDSYAFIDTQNVHLGVRSLGWQIDWKRFRVHLRETYGVATAYQFIGYMPEHERMYQALQRYGYLLVFKPVMYRHDGKPKGNVDAEVVLQAMIDYPNYNQAVIVTSDGDFACLVRHLRERSNLKAVISPTRAGCSTLLRQAARGQLDVLDRLRGKIEYLKR